MGYSIAVAVSSNHLHTYTDVKPSRAMQLQDLERLQFAHADLEPECAAFIYIHIRPGS
jgi:hypothetical protein